MPDESRDTSVTAATPEAAFGHDAVRDALATHPVFGPTLDALQSFISDAKWDRGELTLTVAPESIVSAVTAAKDTGYNFMEDLTAVDWFPSEPRFQVTYSLLSHRLKQRIRVVARLGGDNPVIDSITGVWPGANFYEREVYDLFGITFAGHPRLTRIMMPDNWNGHPLRKDYPVEGYR
jgi:NADH-quinone oxidoreductase subunit C